MTRIEMRCILFDVWHTIVEPEVDSREYYRIRVRALLNSCGVPAADLDRALEAYLQVHEEIENIRSDRLVEIPAAEEVRRFFSRLGLDCDVGPAQLRAFAEPFLKATRVKEGAVAAIQFARKSGFALGVLANSPHPGMIRERLRMAGLEKFFDAILVSAEVGYRKPHPRAFLSALEALNAPPQGAIMVGDDPKADISGAKSIGMTTVWVKREGLAPPEEADAIVESLADLPRALREIGWV